MGSGRGDRARGGRRRPGGGGTAPGEGDRARVGGGPGWEGPGGGGTGPRGAEGDAGPGPGRAQGAGRCGEAGSGGTEPGERGLGRGTVRQEPGRDRAGPRGAGTRLSRAGGEVTGLGTGARGGCDSSVSPQAKYLAQIILVGAQVVGRAFMRALRQEFAGRSRAAAPHIGMLLPVWSMPMLPSTSRDHHFCPHPLPQGTPLLPVPQGCAWRRRFPGLSQGDSQCLHAGASLMAFQFGLGSPQPSQAPAWTRQRCQTPRHCGSPKGQSGMVPQDMAAPALPCLLLPPCSLAHCGHQQMGAPWFLLPPQGPGTLSW